jgi:predicted AAA+ superfamily ATPase
MKKISYDREFRNVWFWRTTQQKEIDLIEEADGELTAFEFKWNNEKGKVKMPSQFEAAYRDAKFSVITPANIDQFLL